MWKYTRASIAHWVDFNEGVARVKRGLDLRARFAMNLQI